jgi:hypothetical protein
MEMVRQQRARHRRLVDPGAHIGDRVQELAFLARCEQALEEAEDVLEDVGVLAWNL